MSLRIPCGEEAVSRVCSSIGSSLTAKITTGEYGEPILRACITTRTNFDYPSEIKTNGGGRGGEASGWPIPHVYLGARNALDMDIGPPTVAGKGATPWEKLITSESADWHVSGWYEGDSNFK